MAKRLKIVNQQGQVVSWQSQEMIFDPEKPQVKGLAEKERVEAVCWLINRSATGGPFHVEEVEG